MTRDEITKTLAGMLTVNQEEQKAIEEAIAIITDGDWRDQKVGVPDEDSAGPFHEAMGKMTEAWNLVNGK